MSDANERILVLSDLDHKDDPLYLVHYGVSYLLNRDAQKALSMKTMNIYFYNYILYNPHIHNLLTLAYGRFQLNEDISAYNAIFTDKKVDL